MLDKLKQYIDRFAKSGASGSDSAGHGAAGSSKDAAPSTQPSSVAVLPFVNMTGDEDTEYFAQGITEEIIVSICRLRGIKVVSRTSVTRFRDPEEGVQNIARILDVDTVLEGSVRKSSDRVRIVAQLIDAKLDTHLWVETYDRGLENIFEIQGDVAARIARSLRAEFTAADALRARRIRTSDMDAYDLYLKGRHLWGKRTEDTLVRGIELFRKALALDPNFPDAHAALAQCHATVGLYGLEAPHRSMPLARDAAARALELESDMASALTARGCVRAAYEWDFKGADEDFQQATSIDSNDATGHHWYATNVLAPLGRFDDARKEVQRARELEPLNPAVNTTLALLDALTGDLNEAAAGYHAVLELEPSFALAHYFLGQTLTELGRFEDAMAAINRAIVLSRKSPECLSALAYLDARAGRTDLAREGLKRLIGLRDTRYVSDALLAQVHVALGETEAALKCLDQGEQERVPEMIWLAVRPSFRDLAGEPRFEAIKARVGLVPGVAA